MILITGAFGQLGRLLIEKLLKTDEKLLLVDRNIYEESIFSFPSVTVVEGDLSDVNFCNKLFQEYHVENIFNFATNSFVEREHQINLSQRCYIFDNIIHALDNNNQKDDIWILHPLSSEIFGIPAEIPQNEETVRLPINTYGLQKSLEELKCKFLREKGFKIYNPILNNAESKFRSENFFTRKIISNLMKLNQDQEFQCVEFYNSLSSRDFGYAGDYINNFLIAAKQKRNYTELLGSGINITIIDFILEVLNTLELETDIKSDKDGYLEIYHDGRIILKEKGRSSIDEKRIFKASTLNQNQKKVKIRGGIELIKLLIND